MESGHIDVSSNFVNLLPSLATFVNPLCLLMFWKYVFTFYIIPWLVVNCFWAGWLICVSWISYHIWHLMMWVVAIFLHGWQRAVYHTLSLIWPGDARSQGITSHGINFLCSPGIWAQHKKVRPQCQSIAGHDWSNAFSWKKNVFLSKFHNTCVLLYSIEKKFALFQPNWW